jgi:hypothetical protein
VQIFEKKSFSSKTFTKSKKIKRSPRYSSPGDLSSFLLQQKAKKSNSILKLPRYKPP